jgi:ABC-2 type transport system permease protein
MIWRPVWGIIEREMVRMLRQRGRLVSAAARPLIWLVVIGSGFNAMLGPLGPHGYHHFLVPGVLGMVMLFGAMLVSLTLVYDKEFGVMRLLIVAPLPHYWIVVAKIISGAVVAVVQAAAFALLLAIFGYVGPEVSMVLLALGLVTTALACASLGMVIAVWSSTLDNFAVVMNFVIFPVFFLSGALYPVHKLPDFLKVVAAINPFTYGVDILKHALLGSTMPLLGTDFGVLVDVAVLVGFTVVATFVACLRFSHESAAGLLQFLRTH